MILYQLDPVQDSNDVTRQHATKSVLTSGLHSEPLGNRGWGAMSAYCTMALYCSNPTSTDLTIFSSFAVGLASVSFILHPFL